MFKLYSINTSLVICQVAAWYLGKEWMTDDRCDDMCCWSSPVLLQVNSLKRGATQNPAESLFPLSSVSAAPECYKRNFRRGSQTNNQTNKQSHITSVNTTDLRNPADNHITNFTVESERAETVWRSTQISETRHRMLSLIFTWSSEVSRRWVYSLAPLLQQLMLWVCLHPCMCHDLWTWATTSQSSHVL